ncbi:uncharacterized protein BXZ73DRAFT_78323 [Epithele typhae]|uniref:uncharacterized protein n=1 Tax=Epithele typhae TaxID=378194 RepID=UPI002007AEF5|nr:uncharacterized protein BXZ73DRAFT_78323 [Epithele typhae]KAH9928510.1 hypothetical protein BXZ73DRAFT_78323 [Epithele typhae]
MLTRHATRGTLSLTRYIPIEVVETVIDELGAQEDLRALSLCARVCSTWLPRSRFHFWRKVLVTSRKKLWAILRALGHAEDINPLVQVLRLQSQDSGYVSPASTTGADDSFILLAMDELLRRLPNLNTLEIVARDEHLDLTSPDVLISFFECHSLRTLVLEECRIPSSACLHQMLRSLPALREVRLCEVDFWEGPGETPLDYSNLRLQKLTLHSSANPPPLLEGILNGSATTLTDLDISCQSLFETGTVMDLPRLLHLMVKIDLDDEDIFREWDPEQLHPTNSRLPPSLRSLNITLHSGAVSWFGVDLNERLKQEISAFTRLVQEHGILRTSGIKCILEDVHENLRDRWLASLEKVFSVLHARDMATYGHISPAIHMAFAENNQWAASYAKWGFPGAGSVIIWDVTSGKPALEQWDYPVAQLSREEPHPLVFSPSNTLLAYCTRHLQKIFRLQEAEEGTGTHRRQWQELGGIDFRSRIVRAAAWTPDSKQIVFLVDAGAVDIWDAETLTHTRTLLCPFPFVGNDDELIGVTAASLSVSADGQFALCYIDKSYNFGPVHSEHVCVWDLVSCTCSLRFPALAQVRSPEQDRISEVSFRPPLEDAADPRPGHWDVLAHSANGKLFLDTAAQHVGNDGGPSVPLTSLLEGLHTIDMSPDGRFAICIGPRDGHPDSSVYRIVDTRTRETVFEPFETEESWPARFSPNASAVVFCIAGRRNSTQWGYLSLQDGIMYAVRVPEGQEVHGLVLSEDGSLVARSCWSGAMIFDRISNAMQAVDQG